MKSLSGTDKQPSVSIDGERERKNPGRPGSSQGGSLGELQKLFVLKR